MALFSVEMAAGADAAGLSRYFAKDSPGKMIDTCPSAVPGSLELSSKGLGEAYFEDGNSRPNRRSPPRPPPLPPPRLLRPRPPRPRKLRPPRSLPCPRLSNRGRLGAEL